MTVVAVPSTAPVTALEIIRQALRKIGAIDPQEAPKAEEVSVALDALNGIIDTWSATSGTALNNDELVVTLPAMTKTMSIGPGQDIDIDRPFRIESAYARISQIDRPIQVVDKGQYDAVTLKGIGTSWPEILWYDGNIPVGNLYFWPLASSSVELHVTLLNFLRAFADQNASQYLPRGMKRALVLALAIEVAPEFALTPSPDLIKQAALAYRAYFRSASSVPDMDSDTRVTSRLGAFLGGGF